MRPKINTYLALMRVMASGCSEASSDASRSINCARPQATCSMPFPLNSRKLGSNFGSWAVSGLTRLRLDWGDLRVRRGLRWRREGCCGGSDPCKRRRSLGRDSESEGDSALVLELGRGAAKGGPYGMCGGTAGMETGYRESVNIDGAGGRP